MSSLLDHFHSHDPEVGMWHFTTSQPVDPSLPVALLVERMYQGAVLVDCNEAFASMYGAHDKSQMIGLPLSDLLPVTDQNMRFLEALVTNNFKLEGYATKEVDQNGRPVHFINDVEVTFENGFITGAIGRQRTTDPT